MDTHKLAQAIASLAERVARKDIELTDPAILEIPKKKLEKKLNKRWPDGITYKGKSVFQEGYKHRDKAEEAIEDEGYTEHQECYLGYVPSKDMFVMGFDLWEPEPDEDDEDWGDEGEDWDGRYGALKTRWAAIKKAYGGTWGFVEIKGSRVGTAEIGWGSMFYHGGYKKVRREYPDILDLRLD